MHVERPSNSDNLGAHFLAFVESLYVFPYFLTAVESLSSLQEALYMQLRSTVWVGKVPVCVCVSVD